VASRGVNKVIIVGNCGQDPETKYMPSGGAVTNISVATSEAWKDKQTGQPQERTEWHRVVFFNRLAEIAGEYLRKGSKVYVEGALRTRKWQGQDGQDRYTTEIVASEMQMLDTRASGDSQAYGGGYQQAAPGQAPSAPPQATAQQPMQQPAHQPAHQPAQQQPGHQPPAAAPQPSTASHAAPPPAMDSFDDDIPF